MRYLKSLVFTAAMALSLDCSSNLLAGTVEGIELTVVAGDGPTPIYNSTVTLRGETTGYSAESGSAVDGTVSFKGVPDGDYSVEAQSKNGVLRGKMRVRVEDGRSPDAMYFKLKTPSDGATVLLVNGTYDRVGDTMERLGYLFTTIDAADLADPGTFAATDVLILESGCDTGPAADPTVVANLRDFVKGGGRLVVSGRANDYIDGTWPGTVNYIDGASGSAYQETAVEFDNADLRGYMLNSTIKISYELGGFPVMSGTTGTVLASGNVKYGDAVADDAPVAVGFYYGEGAVTYTNFVWSEQEDPGEPARRFFNYILANR